MNKYDPFIKPDPEKWLAMDEAERIALIEIYHEDAGIEIEGVMAHMTFHCIIENQIAEGDEVVSATLKRLKREGLDRHDAIHAIASVLAGRFYDVFARDKGAKNSNLLYYRKLKKLSAKRWLRGR